MAGRTRPEDGSAYCGLSENPDYLSTQLITCIGNKRALLPKIEQAILQVKARLNKKHLRFFDLFSGSGVVSRLMKSHAAYLAANDLEDYAQAVSDCFLQNKEDLDQSGLLEITRELNRRVDGADFPKGFIEELYAPADEQAIKREDRVFYTRQNARRLDNFRRLLDTLEPKDRRMLLGPLIGKASVHANTSGVFKGFHKDRYTKTGRFGGTNADALKRILGPVTLEAPVLSNFACEVEIFKGRANDLAGRVKNIDLAYLDPPYNQHPYGSNYFMLNLLTNYQRPEKISKVSGIPANWRRSDYNVRSLSKLRLRQLIESLDARFVLISFNNEGFIEKEEMLHMLSEMGLVETLDTVYNAFRGSRNISKRSIYVSEFMFLLQKK